MARPKKKKKDQKVALSITLENSVYKLIEKEQNKSEFINNVIKEYYLKILGNARLE